VTGKKVWWVAGCCAAVLAAATASALAAGKGHGKARSAHKVERLACKLGTEDRHARIAVEVRDGRVERFAYYSKWKPRTCSVYVVRDDSFSHWEDAGSFTAVTTEKGSFLIEETPQEVQFLFRNVDRMFYCGMEGKITGTLTVTRGEDRCALEGVMDENPDTDQPRPMTVSTAPQSRPAEASPADGASSAHDAGAAAN